MQFLLFVVVLHSLNAQAPKGRDPFVTLKEPPALPLLFDRTVPEFTAKDINGKVWSNRDLAGKVTVVCRWAIQCLPCQDALQQLQRFSEEIRGRKDIQLLTFSDEGVPLVVIDFMKDSGYTFPVIVGRQLAGKLFPFAMGPPGLWIVDREGRGSPGRREWTPGRVLIEAERLAGRQ